MPDDLQAAAANTGGAIVVYGVTLSNWVLIGWLVYIGLIVVLKLPDIPRKFPFVRVLLVKLLGMLRGRKN
ncbi:hypothetical protein [Eoetvoesiella caeni]|uniref:Uncharacterized protein n=1 Tax=Eoetvoesiella caeni TaxID=645616 RepID=A0A366HBF4_9BURK|nr:hypothetical protein [Eoetvoesiella caeni]MCI2809401.1 hypothetical protein [Eoetvoesiella caeni]NYT54542.1 hypothetical protein [Eoetvoesiella caeni]RBP39268.1 hypothetical protein DFR37_10559 [Eoetvoesiella caeni]